jgi:hypothetical protein
MKIDFDCVHIWQQLLIVSIIHGRRNYLLHNYDCCICWLHDCHSFRKTKQWNGQHEMNDSP